MPPNAHSSAPRSSLITVMAKIALTMGGMGVAWALLQCLVAAMLPQQEIAALGESLPIPPLFIWILTHLPLLSLLGLFASALFVVVSWGLLRRQPWARWAFIAFLVAGALANFASIPLMRQMMDSLAGLYPANGADAAEMLAQLHYTRFTALASAWVTSLVFAVLHGWIIWKLSTAEIRAEFRR